MTKDKEITNMAKNNPMQILFNNPHVKLVGSSMIPVTNKPANFGPQSTQEIMKSGNHSNRAGCQYTSIHSKGSRKLRSL